MPSSILRKVTATWTTPFAEDFWRKLDGLKTAVSKDGDLLTLGPTLPNGEDDRIAEVVVHRDDEDGALHWALAVGPAPEGEPPPEVREHDAKLRGRKGLSELLVAPLSVNAPALGAFRVRCVIPATDRRCRMIPMAVEKGGPNDPALLIGAARLEQVGYRFDAGASGIEEVAIVYAHLTDEYSLTIDAKGSLKLGSPRWLPYADDIVDIAVSTFFSPVGGAQ